MPSIKPLYWLRSQGKLCDEVHDCVNTNIDETDCDKAKTSMSSLMKKGYTEVDECNGKLAIAIDAVYHHEYFEDESDCNGYKYGLHCGETYYPPIEVCYRKSRCGSNDIEDICTATKFTQNSCIHRKTGKYVPMFDITRCGAFQLDDMFTRYEYINYINTNRYESGERLDAFTLYDDFDNPPEQYFSYCQNFLDQSNCTDPDRTEMKCKIGGYLSTVSKLKICVGNPICDDALDTTCIALSQFCYVHKHKLCDNIVDCQDGSDETHYMCKGTTEKGCQRMTWKVGVLPLPLSWLHDGVEDCLDGSDEQEGWLTCGVGDTLRFVRDNSSCENVLLCQVGEPGYVEFSLLCDGRETCGNEQEMCDMSHGKKSLSRRAMTRSRGLSKHLSYCIDGLSSVQNLTISCTTDGFIFPKQEIFGIEKTKVHLPKTTRNCDHLYGEDYVYTSCNGRCLNSSCPLEDIPKYDSCPGQYPNRVGTLVNNEYITFFRKSFYNVYVNDFFVCKNRLKCVDYAQVCDLVDDCRDGSDEAQCTNHFLCKDNKTRQYIPATKLCDGRIDCLDLSDECNKECSKEILSNVHLKRISWTIGVSSVAANSVIMARTLISLRKSRTSVAFINKSLILAISMGDLMVGSYLLVISVLDTAVFGKDYCLRQTSWLTSFGCSMLGIFSTFGSQVSLFSMTGLSLVRLFGIWNSMRIPGEVNLKKVLQILVGMVTIVLCSVVIAVTPLIKNFEDFFVNGLHYDPGMKIFMGFSDKDKHFSVLEKYYGRMRNRTLTWSQINKMVDGMFSHDLGYEDFTKTKTKVDFFGNDGVCLFKYFVKEQDPQRMFVWAILFLNFACFIFISVSYVIIAFLSHKSSKSVATAGNDKQLQQRQQRMNRRISMIIVTDFLCWAPFIITCILHSLELVDATDWYALFSMVVLPINSVINPILYDDFISKYIEKASSKVSAVTQHIIISSLWRSISRNPPETAEDDIAMNEINS